MGAAYGHIAQGVPNTYADCEKIKLSRRAFKFKLVLTTLECIAHDKGAPLGTFFVQRGHCPYRHKHWHYGALALRQTLDHACHLRAF